MDAIDHRISAWDGLALRALEWPGETGRIPLLCLPGFVRTAGDFARVADALPEHRAIAVDYAGRGASGRARDVARYAPEACLRDIMDVAAALHLHRAVVLGTSYGGLLAMGLAAARPAMLAGVVLNDIGPEIGEAGRAFIEGFIGRDPAFATLGEAIALLRRVLPPLSLETDADWEEMAHLTYDQGSDGRWHPNWDTRLARTMRGRIPDLWALFRGLAQIPVLLIRGGESNILSATAAQRMRAIKPDMRFLELPGIGHAPTLFEPASLTAIRRFLSGTECAGSRG